jgi:hypothetical protein
MGAAQDRLAAWLRQEIAPRLREHGYKGSGQNFHCRFDAHWGVVNIQRSQWDWAERATFTINLGTASDLVLEETGDDPSKPPSEPTCQWRTRLGGLVANRDVWWEVRGDSDDASLAALSDEVGTALLNVGLPAIAEHADDKAILTSVLEGQGQGWGGVEVAGILLHHRGGTDEQRARFNEMVSSGRRFRSSLQVEQRPAQGPKRTETNLRLIADSRADKRVEAAYLLGGAKPSASVVDALRRALDDSVERVRIKAAASLVDLSDLPSLDRALSMVRGTPNRFGASDLAMSLARLATRDPSVRLRIETALRDRLAHAIGFDLVGVGVALEQLEAPSQIV